MQDVTLLVLKYRECTRLVWNNFLRVDVEHHADFDALDRFSQISSHLFADLVLGPIGQRAFAKESVDDPFPFLSLKPTVEIFPVMISRPSSSGRYWDDPIAKLNAASTTLLLVDFFDWDRFGFIDLQYFRSRIARCDEHPELVGRDALVEVLNAKVVFDG